MKVCPNYLKVMQITIDVLMLMTMCKSCSWGWFTLCWRARYSAALYRRQNGNWCHLLLSKFTQAALFWPCVSNIMQPPKFFIDKNSFVSHQSPSDIWDKHVPLSFTDSATSVSSTVWFRRRGSTAATSNSVVGLLSGLVRQVFTGIWYQFLRT